MTNSTEPIESARIRRCTYDEPLYQMSKTRQKLKKKSGKLTDHNCLQQFDKFLILWSSSPIYRKWKFWKLLLHWKKNRELTKRKRIYSWRIFVICNHCDVRRKEGRRGDSSVWNSTFRSSATTEWRARQCTLSYVHCAVHCTDRWCTEVHCCTAPASSPSVEYAAVGSTFVVPSLLLYYEE